MAKDMVRDRSSAINSSCLCYSSFSQADWEEFIDNHLAKSQALLQVALQHGIYECSNTTQHHYFSVLDDLLNEVIRGIQQLRLPPSLE